MGGVITVAVRFGDGTVRCQEALTGSTPFWLQTPQVLEADEDYLRGFLDSPDRRFVEPMPVAPTEYGLVVVDCMTRTLVEMSDYTSLGYFYHILIRNEILRGYGVRVRYDAVTGFLKRGRLRHRLGFRDRDGWKRTWSEPGEPLDVDALVPLLSSYDRCYEATRGWDEPLPDLRLDVDWSPWDLRSFKWRGVGDVEEPPSSGRELLRGLGFDVSHPDWDDLDAQGYRIREDCDADDGGEGGLPGDPGGIPARPDDAESCAR